jgi:hypothetical protein
MFPMTTNNGLCSSIGYRIHMFTTENLIVSGCLLYVFTFGGDGPTNYDGHMNTLTDLPLSLYTYFKQTLFIVSCHGNQIIR